ncbi:BAG family molecular chaperone regulator 7 [Magnolia sinica]|uniref:BAG family molecular chaperone regulator 7 n=1 Tax=Magnolia sinica TaxID=86752 RepID=UPI002658244F|nr:BAG family molecular chaperone regulator 7 [Magnolia sinica]
MSGFKRVDHLEPSSSLFYREASFFRSQAPFLLPFSPYVAEDEELAFTLDLLNPKPTSSLFDLSAQCLISPPYAPPSPFDLFETATDLIQIERTLFSSSIRRFQERKDTSFYLKNLADRVSALELGFDRVLNGRTNGGERKFKWTAEIKAPEKKNGVDRKYTWTAEIKGEGRDLEKNCKWMAEYKGKGKDSPVSHTYTFKASTAPPAGSTKASKKAAKDSNATTHVVEIEDTDRPAVALRRAFTRRAAVVNNSKGKKKDLSPLDAALIIQMSFRAHLVRRSQVLRALRDLAVAKAKLKEIRALFSNYSYRRRITVDAEEHQRFSEKIIVLLLTVDAIEGPDHIVRAARKSIVDELEAMLDVVDPQPPGKLGSMKRRRFDLPENGPISKEMASGVAEVVQMLDEEDHGSSAAFRDL